MKFPVWITAVAVLAAAPAAFGDTIVVPSPGIPDIQTAVNWSNPGDVILVLPGEFPDHVTISGKAGLELRGKGWPVLLGAADIAIFDSTGIVVRGLQMDGTRVNVSTSVDVNIAGMRFRNGSFAIKGDENDGILVSRCDFRNQGSEAISLLNTDGLVVERCRFGGIGSWAIILFEDFGGSDRAVIRRNRVMGAAGGFALSGEDFVVEDNRMTGLSLPGIWTHPMLGQSLGFAFRRNRIQTTGEAAIDIDGGDATLERNTLVGAGMWVGAMGSTLRENRVTRASGDGIVVNTTAVVERNQVRGAAAVGISVSGDGTALVGNSVSGTSGDGLVVVGSNCRVSRNRASGAGGNGFLVDGTGNLVTENRASKSGGFDLADTASAGANDYAGNLFGTEEFDFVP